jgi:Flp pilus assembly pilin Flp
LHYKDFLREEGGQDLVEYSLLLAFIALAAIALLSSAGISIKTNLDRHKHPIDKRCRVLGTGPHRTVEKRTTGSPLEGNRDNAKISKKITGKLESHMLSLSAPVQAAPQ